jgi:formamidopyrimidine-DNA glycosylase
MPELPDVEGFRRYFGRHASGRTVERIEVLDRTIVRNATPQGLGRILKGNRVGRPRRYGKWLLAPVGDETLLFHFGMTGGLEWGAGSTGRDPHDRVVLRLEGGELRYRNMRKLGGVWLSRDESDTERILGRLGPDALDLDRDGLAKVLEGRRGALKPTLMNQAVVAGIGNELSDEILWQARLNPRRTVPSLGSRGEDALFRAWRKVLRASVRAGRIPRRKGWLTAVRGRPDPRCPRCRGPIRTGRVAGRTAYWCPRCQRG